jgi:L-fuculose-phosphate aldolase
VTEKKEPAAPRALITAARALAAAGLNAGAAGNVSCRAPSPEGEEGFWITPSGMNYATLRVKDIPWVRLDGAARGLCQPSSEWRIHRDIYLNRAEIGAVAHTHSPFATALSCFRRDIPPFHYMIARFGGDTVRCAAYAPFGSEALSRRALEALAGRSACLLANHGAVACGSALTEAVSRCAELETLCQQYHLASQLGEPTLLSAEEMRAVHAQFQSYGQKSSACPRLPR